MSKKTRELKRQQRAKVRKQGKVKILGAQLKEKGCALCTTYKKKVKQSIRLQILWMVSIAFILASIGGGLISNIAKGLNVGYYTYLDYRMANEQLQNQLTRTVREINNLEYVHLAKEIDIDRLYSTVKSIKAEEVDIDQLREVLNEWNRIEYEGNYSSEAMEKGRMSLHDVSREEIRKLYAQFLELISKDEWTKEKVNTLISEFFESQGITEEKHKETAIIRLLSNLDSNISYASDTKTFLIDSKGNMIYGDNFIKSINILEAIRKASISSETNESEQRTSIYPVIMNGEIYYLLNDTVLTGVEQSAYTNTAEVVGFLSGVIIFIYIILRETKAKIKYIEYLGYCLGEISKGDLDFQVEQRGDDELARVASAMTKMEYELKEQMRERAQSEKTKSELITNVAHDLRTPLTSVIGYIGLVKEEKATTKEESAKYLEIAYNKAERLKILIEDLFEYTKLSNRSVKLKQEILSIATLVSQLTEELMPLAEEKSMCIQYRLAAKETNASIDVLKMTRVFENLIENAIKYSEEGENIQVVIQETKTFIYVTVSNKNTGIKEDDVEKLVDRFYRSDHSRNSMAGGSGLGLAIAKNIVEMHGGKIWAQLDGDKIHFNVKLHKA